jgi:hypothetical protein
MDQHSQLEQTSLICFGLNRDIAEKMSTGIAPLFRFAAIVSEWEVGSSESKDVLNILIKHLNPAPRGVIVGGAFNEEQRAEIKHIVDAHGLKYIAVPATFLQEHGPAATLQWGREALEKEFGVHWQ